MERVPHSPRPLPAATVASVQAAGASAGPGGLFVLAAAGRFHRHLFVEAAARQDVPWKVPHGTEAADGSPEGDAGAAAPIAPCAEPLPPPPPPPPACAGARPEGRHGDGGARGKDPERGRGDAPVRATTALPAGAPPAWLQDTVQRIAWLCARADPAFQSWSVTVPMDPAVLPDSEAVLSLSPYAMHLRFRTGSPESAHLISLHRDPLRAQLEALGPGQRGIDIDLEPLP